MQLEGRPEGGGGVEWMAPRREQHGRGCSNGEKEGKEEGCDLTTGGAAVQLVVFCTQNYSPSSSMVCFLYFIPFISFAFFHSFCRCPFRVPRVCFVWPFPLLPRSVHPPQGVTAHKCNQRAEHEAAECEWGGRNREREGMIGRAHV